MRRIVVPFVALVFAGCAGPDITRDPDLPEKLKVEWPGILDWAIKGAVEWSIAGLQPPEIVRLSTDDYLATEDALGTWIAEDCRTGPLLKSTITRLFDLWRIWCEQTGEDPGSRKRFSQNLMARGFERDLQGGTGAKMFKGICERLQGRHNQDRSS